MTAITTNAKNNGNNTQNYRKTKSSPKMKVITNAKQQQQQ